MKRDYTTWDDDSDTKGRYLKKLRTGTKNTNSRKESSKRGKKNKKLNRYRRRLPRLSCKN